MHRLFTWFLLLALTACTNKNERRATSSMFGQPEDVSAPEAFDLSDVQAAGELIAATLSGPDTYYEYRGRGFGLEFELTEAFAHSVGARLRMEMSTDTTTLFHRLQTGEIDLVVLPPDTSTHDSSGLIRLRSGWFVRVASSQLAEAVNGWWKDDTRQQFLEASKRRQREGSGVKRKLRPPMLSRQKGIISSFDNLFVRYAPTAGFDWRLLAAQCYQESGFDPHAVSWAGAQGLMQIMPATAQHLGLASTDVFDPERNIATATRYLRELNATFSDIPDRRERIRFVLAAYNGGVGHVRDAMTLATKNGKNPQQWADVDEFILALSHPRYYRDPDVQFGYLRGSETSGYVRQIMERWDAYRGNASATHPTKPPTLSNPSRVRPRSEFILPKDS